MITAMSWAKVLMEEGHPIIDCLAGHGKVLKLLDAEYDWKQRTFIQRLLNRPKGWNCIKVKYICSGDGKPFESFGTICK